MLSDRITLPLQSTGEKMVRYCKYCKYRSNGSDFANAAAAAFYTVSIVSIVVELRLLTALKSATP